LARDKMTSRTFPEIIRLLIQEQEIEDGWTSFQRLIYV
jgi:hypothetical protein